MISHLSADAHFDCFSGQSQHIAQLLHQLQLALKAELRILLGEVARVAEEDIDLRRLLEQYEREHSHITAWVGLAASAPCLQLFGSQSFIIPAMLCILVVLTLIRGPLERKGI